MQIDHFNWKMSSSSTTGGRTGRGGRDIDDDQSDQDEGYGVDDKHRPSKRYSWKGNLASLKREPSIIFSGPLAGDHRRQINGGNRSRWDRFIIRPDNR